MKQYNMMLIEKVYGEVYSQCRIPGIVIFSIIHKALMT